MEHWYAFVYGYGVGGLIFAVPIVMALRRGNLRMDVPEERRLLIGLLGTFLAYFVVHGVWNLMAIRSF